MQGKDKDKKFDFLAPFKDETSTSAESNFGDSQISVRVTKEFRQKCKAKADEERRSLNEWIRSAMDDRLHYGSHDQYLGKYEKLKDEFEKYKETHPETKNIDNLLNHQASEIADLRRKLDDLQDKFTTILYNKIINK